MEVVEEVHFLFLTFYNVKLFLYYNSRDPKPKGIYVS